MVGCPEGLGGPHSSPYGWPLGGVLVVCGAVYLSLESVMTILTTTDLHLNEKPIDEYRHHFVKRLKKWIEKYSVSHLLILGDLTEEKDRHSAILVNKIFDHISELAEMCEVIILRGNHDYLIPSSPFFKSLGKLKRVRWINYPTVVKDLPLPESVLFLPHTRSHYKDWQGVSVRRHRFVFAHNTFRGAVAENGMEMDGIPRSTFFKTQKVYSGDIHVPQRLGPITYVGAPYTIRFGDHFKPRVMLLDKKGRETFLRCKGTSKVLLDLHPETELVEEDYRAGDILKISIHIPEGNSFDLYSELKNKVEDFFKKIGCVIHVIQPVTPKPTSMLKEAGTKNVTQRTDRELVFAYGRSNKVSKSVLKTGIRILKKSAV